jgi:hypothetical protein
MSSIVDRMTIEGIFVDRAAQQNRAIRNIQLPLESEQDQSGHGS